MILKLNRHLMTCILGLTTFVLHAQAPDTLRGASVLEKSQTITLRMERELSLTREQSAKVMDVLTDRFQHLERSVFNDAALESANRKALQQLSGILSKEQYALYEELRMKKKEERAKFAEDHPAFAFSREDREMDF